MEQVAIDININYSLTSYRNEDQSSSVGYVSKLMSVW